MGTISVKLPESIHKQVKILAKEDGISINQFVATALAEKLSALMTESYLQKRGMRGSREKFEQALSKVVDREPDDYDRL